MKPFENKVYFPSHQQEREISPKSLLFIPKDWFAV
jgi:hypothetical protein